MAEMKTILERNVPDLDHVHACFSQVQEQVSKLELHRDDTEKSLRSHIMELEKVFESTVDNVFYELITLGSSCKEIEETLADLMMQHSASGARPFKRGYSQEVVASRESVRSASDFDSLASDVLEKCKAGVQNLELILETILFERFVTSPEKQRSAAQPFGSIQLKTINQKLAEVEVICRNGASEIVRVACDCNNLAGSLQMELLSKYQGNSMPSCCLQTCFDFQLGQIERLISLTETILTSLIKPAASMCTKKRSSLWSDTRAECESIEQRAENGRLICEVTAQNDENTNESTQIQQSAGNLLKSDEKESSEKQIQLRNGATRQATSVQFSSVLQIEETVLESNDASKMCGIRKVLDHLIASADTCRIELENEMKLLREAFAVAASSLDSERLRNIALEAERKALQSHVDRLHMECTECEIRVAAKDSEIDYLQKQKRDIEARALEAERSKQVLEYEVWEN